MMLHYTHNGKQWRADMLHPFDLAIPLSIDGPRAWYVQPPTFTPVMENGFVGSIAKGGKVNFFNIHFNPHGNGTHTETLGHIDPQQYPISSWRGPYIAHALVVSVVPEEIEKNGVKDHVIKWEQIAHEVEKHRPIALLIRTLPNEKSKRMKDYSNTHFAYLESKIGKELNRLEVMHLLVDLPSVDREQDAGALDCHHAFWGFPEAPRYEATISEMIWLDDVIADGLYCLFLQPPSIQNDAAPSRPLLYATQCLKEDIG